MRILTVAALAAVTALFAGQANGAGPTTPADALRAVERAYAAGDVGALGSVFTDDYEFLTQQGIEFSKAKDLELLRPVIEKNKCVLSFSKEVDLKCITVNPRTWAIPHLETKWAITDKSGTHEVTNLVTLYLIEDMESGVVRIFRWIEEPTALQGCD